MAIEIREVTTDALASYAEIPIAFEVKSIFMVEPQAQGLGGLQLTEVQLDSPYVKDYDASKLERVVGWSQQWDISNWGILLAFEHDVPVGGATVAYDTPGVNMLEDRKDLAVLWDLRVRPDHRGRGIGTALFHHAAQWARAKKCRHLKIETQNINVPACRFYMKMGCELGAIHRHAYDGCPAVTHETMLLWYLQL